MKVISILLLGAAVLCGCASVIGDNFKAESLTVGEFFENPVGRSLEDLSFSWKMPLVRDGAAQSAYRIVVSSGEKQVWDSGKVESSQSVKVPYKGVAIEPRAQYSWRVMIWDEKGNPSEWSDTATFEAGLLKKSDWVGEWISTPESVRDLYTCLLPQKKGGKKLDSRKGVPPAYFRKTFDVKEGLVSARLYIATLGIFEAYANGDKIGNEFWGTGWTQYEKRVTSDTFDITSMLKKGENTVGVIIADGWYAGRIVNREGTSPKPELLAQIELKYADGSTLTIPTNATWKTALGAYAYSDIYDGESFDARLSPKGWDKNGFDASAWKNADAKNISSKNIFITPRRNQPIRVCQQLFPVSVNEVSDGVFVFDLGQNMVGVPRITVKGEAGKQVKIRFAEMLEKDGTLYTANYRSALSTDHFTPASDGLETYQPKFTFHGFRYVELSGMAKGWKPTKDAVLGLVMHNDMPKTGAFECSNAKVNKLQNNIVWGQKSNYFSVPTDCPQRDERMGWTGDAQVFTPTAAFNMNVDGFF